MGTPEPAIGWRTSSHSAGNGNCVEVGDAPSEVHVRDTKNRDGGQLRFPRPGWDAFLAAVRRA